MGILELTTGRFCDYLHGLPLHVKTMSNEARRSLFEGTVDLTTSYQRLVRRGIGLGGCALNRERRAA